MAPSKQKKKQAAQAGDTAGGNVVGLLAVAAAAAVGFWWWRRQKKGGSGGNAGGRSAFKFPAGAQQKAPASAPRGTGTSNKKNKARKKAEKERRAEKRDRAASGPQQAGGSSQGGAEQPASTSVINYTYFDSARKDGLLPAAKKRATLTAADAVKLQQDAAAAPGSSTGGK